MNPGTRDTHLESLAARGVIDAATAESIAARALEGESVEHLLIEAGVTPEMLREHLGQYYELPIGTIAEGESIDPKVLGYLPEESARHYRMIPLRVEDGALIVGVVNPEDYGLRDVLNFITAKYQMPYKLEVLLESDFERGLQSYANLSGEVGRALDQLSTELSVREQEAVRDAGTNKTQAEEALREDAPVTKIIATILRYAVDGTASDIHIEPYDERTIVRFRVDGVLVRSLELPKRVHPAAVARVKILASLRLDERRKPQDGRFSATIDKRQIDFRVSILPTNHGEKVVMRILDTKKGIRTLEDLGTSPHSIADIRAAIQQPYGIILISGPTGSGKSTTLYAMLSEIDREKKNVLSLEDPIEYDIPGVSQSQIRPEIGYTFAAGLRHALRQDPDVIMVGEIRDKETAQLAIQAALTGHLVLSTIHTNSAIGTIPRLIDIGIDPYLIAPTIRVAVAQRLVRRICPGTGRELPIDERINAHFDAQFADLPEQFRDIIPQADHLLQAEPSTDCTTGTRGRVAVMETMPVDDEIEQLILENASEDELYKAARAKGFISMKEDAIFKALRHTIPFEEVDALGGDLASGDAAGDPLTEAGEAVPDPDTPSVDNRAVSDTPAV